MGCVLLWGIPAEPPLAAVQTQLAAQGTSTFLFDQRDVANASMELSVDAGGVHGWLRTPAGTCALHGVTAMYARPYDTRALPAVTAAGPASRLWQHALDLDATMWAWSEVTPALVVNRLGPTSSNGSKPDQLERIRHTGLLVPATLITTDAAELEVFWNTHGNLVYKSVSATRSIVQRLTAAHRGRLDDLATCPTQFQAEVRGTDVRVHVVGAELFATEIASGAADYRYAGDRDVVLRATTLPANVAARCRAAARALELPVAGIDLRRTPDDEWYCFEVNPSPAFTFFEEATGQPIAAAIARLLGGLNGDVGESGVIVTRDSPTQPIFGAYPT
jgi:hypothetical protein